MPHVVTQACCGDASCVYACPVNCIHPTPEEPDFGSAEMLYIDPSTCVDCGACVSACPVGAIVPGHRLPKGQERFADLNALAYGVSLGMPAIPAAEEPAQPAAAADTNAEITEPVSGSLTEETEPARFPVDDTWRLPLAPIDAPRRLEVAGPISVGIVGSGPSAMYAADELLRHPQVRVTMYERLRRPFGLARYGVAPDHTATRSVMRLFDDIASNPRLDISLGIEIGRDISLEELRVRHDAVLWAGGAPTDKPLTIPGAASKGVLSATSLVGWYNDHPDFDDVPVDLRTERAVVIGNGNVALDVARILTSDPERLAPTTISRHALAALRSSSISEVVVLGRRGPAHAAFTLPELVGLVDGGAIITVDQADLATAVAGDDPTIRAKLALLGEIAGRQPSSGPSIRLAFWQAPVEIATDGARVVGVRTERMRPSLGGTVEPTGEFATIDAGLVLTSIGYRGRPVPGLPFDDARGVIPHDAGRVVGEPGMYVTGWIKRGPSGFIGTNKTDSAETVASLLRDAESGLLTPPAAVPLRRKVRDRLLTHLR